MPDADADFGVASKPLDRRSTATREALVQGAIDVLRNVGFARASARAIAASAGCNQALIFYHFGSVANLLLAALDAVSARRLAEYASVLDGAESPADLIESARAIFSEDLDAGHITVLSTMITGAQSMPELGAQIVEILTPWQDFAETALRKAASGAPFEQLLPAREFGHAIVAGFLGLELLASLNGDRTLALALFERARQIAALLELTLGTFPVGGSE